METLYERTFEMTDSEAVRLLRKELSVLEEIHSKSLLCVENLRLLIGVGAEVTIASETEKDVSEVKGYVEEFLREADDGVHVLVWMHEYEEFMYQKNAAGCV
jgi:hypothetical protein